MTVADLFREARTRAGLTQPELAERAGLSRSTILRVENGHMLPGAASAFALADVLGVPYEDVSEALAASRRRQPLSAEARAEIAACKARIRELQSV